MDGAFILLILIIIVLIVIFVKDKNQRIKELEEKFNTNNLTDKEYDEYRKLVNYKKIEEKYVNGTATKNEIKLFKQKLDDDVKQNKLYMETEAMKRKAETIKKVMIVSESTDSRKKVGSAIMRGTIGGALLGPVGLVGGALSGKNKITNKTTFLVEYEDGHRETKIVDNNSYEFEKLCKYLEM